MLSPPIGSHQPDTRIRLRIQVNDQNFLTMKLCQASSDVNHRCSFADTAFEVNECQDSGAHDNPLFTYRGKTWPTIKLFFAYLRSALGVRRSAQAGMMEDSSTGAAKNHLLSTRHL